MRVNEIYGPVIQGEGVNAGLPVYFLRLAMCNLHCDWCDTKYTWDWKNYDFKTEAPEQSTEEIVKRLHELKTGESSNLVITGGEPLLQQAELQNLLHNKDFIEWRNDGWIEVETNGTQEPWDLVVYGVNQFNVSIKLSNNRIDNKTMRIVPSAIRKFIDSGKAWFKFVVDKKEDISEIAELRLEFGIPRERIIIMPQVKEQEKYDTRMKEIIELAKANELRFSPRLHVEAYGTRRGI